MKLTLQVILSFIGFILYCTSSIAASEVSINTAAVNIGKFAGSWVTPYSKDGAPYCNSTLTLNSDGSFQYDSADKSQNGSYELDKASIINNSYKIIFTIVKDSGGTGCRGESIDWTGRNQVVFVRPLSSGDLLVSPCEGFTECRSATKLYSKPVELPVNKKSLPECTIESQEKFKIYAQESAYKKVVYPRDARRYELEGSGVAAIVQDSTGQTISLELIQSAGHELLDNAMIKAVKDADITRGCYLKMRAILFFPFTFNLLPPPVNP